MKSLSVTSPKNTLKKDWELSSKAFDGLLKWLDDGENSEGNTYLAMRSRLVTYFDRKNCSDPQMLADDTLNRVGRRLEEEGQILTDAPARYCYTIARFVFLEHLRNRKTVEVSLDDVSKGGRHLATTQDNDEAERREAMSTCLDQCSGSLDHHQRDLIFRYYSGEKRPKIENRRLLAEEMGVSLNALTIRAFRTREKLEACMNKCLAARERN